MAASHHSGSRSWRTGTPAAEKPRVTLTIAIIVNIVLMAGIVAALAYVVRIPFRIERHIVHRGRRVRAEQDESLRAA